MPSILTLRRRDPWWGLEGPAARRRHRRKRILTVLAFVASCLAIAGAGIAWSIQLGFAAMLGFHLHLVIG
ncbi:MAG TPA: hypothetical protein VE011_03830 [Candidatus Dormibacteraeota bacterium]|nr:hypothetical protein [Candidatus Dormibacteraeota bacterium]